MDEQALLLKLREAFKEESEERLANLSTRLLELENGSDKTEQESNLEIVFREAHSLKGAARAVNLIEIEQICQAVESVFSVLKTQEIEPSPEIFDAIHASMDLVDKILSSESMEEAVMADEVQVHVDRLDELRSASCEVAAEETSNFTIVAKEEDSILPEQKRAGETGNAEKLKAIENDVEKDVLDEPSESKPEIKIESQPRKKSETKRKEADHPDQVLIEKPPPEEQKTAEKQNDGSAPAPTLNSETVRIPTRKLDSVLLKAEELVSLKLMSGQHLSDLKEVMPLFKQGRNQMAKVNARIKTLRHDMMDDVDDNRRLNQATLAEVIEFMDWISEHMGVLERKNRTLVKEGEQNQHLLDRMVDDLLDDMKQVTMLPFSTLMNIFPKMIRDLSRDLEKKIEFDVTGSEVEIDRRILEEMKDPLVHVLRNSVDHGIELPEERVDSEKPEQGVIRVEISQAEGSKVQIVIADDGRGMDPEKLKSKAVEQGLLTREAADQLSEQEALALILHSGFSTSRIITNLSGRGVGCAILQERVEKLGGTVAVESKPGEGCAFRIVLPVTLATFRGILVRVSDRLFVLPTGNVERVCRIEKESKQSVEGRTTLSIAGRVIPCVDLAELLSIPSVDEGSEPGIYMTLAVLGSGDRQVAFRIDQVLSEQDVLVKNLGSQLRRVRNIAGATVLGSGKAVPILNVQDLLKSAVNVSVRGSTEVRKKAKEGMGQRSILVAEDSITSRMLVKSILESAGYKVETAVDGLDAFNILKTNEFDLVVSDVEMPKMTGFDLTEKIRSDQSLSDIPVVLCTSLSTPEDKARGIDAGANAYIIKSNFDQSDLLNVIERLL